MLFGQRRHSAVSRPREQGGDKAPEQPTDFRGDIEGLRGIAVLAVVIYHFQLGIAPGGFVGVDVFFVLSGFLITGLLQREIARNGRISFAGFWARRVRRILPAATLVLLASLIGLIELISPLDIRHSAGDIGAAATFLINWRLAHNAVDYFARSEPPSIVLHYWSLAVEEQFYLLWPAALALALLLHRRLPKTSATGVFMTVTSILWMVSFALTIYLASRNAPLAFFATTTRMWQLLTGALVALLVYRRTPYEHWLLSGIGWLGLAAVLAAVLLLADTNSYPGWTALLPTFGTAALIATGVGGPAPLLAVFPLRFLGRISYSWYLWHWPFIWFGNQTTPHMSLIGQLALFIGSFCAGLTSYHLVESPARYNAYLVRSARLSLAFGVLLVAISLAAASITRWVYADPKIVLHDRSVIPISKVRNDLPRIYFDGCHLSEPLTKYADCEFGVPSGVDAVVLFGDSHAAQYFPALESAARQMGWQLLARTKSSCSPTVGALWNFEYRREYYECEIWRRAVLDEIRRKHPKLVIVASDLDYLSTSPTTGQSATASHEVTIADERRLIDDLLRDAQSVVLIRDTPKFPTMPLRCLANNPGREHVCQWQLESSLPKERFPVSLELLDPRVHVADLTPEICENGICNAVRNSIIQFHDDHHLSATGASTLAPQFVELLTRAAAPALPLTPR